MWINDASLKTYEFLYQIRDDYPNQSLPENLTNEVLESMGIYEVVSTPEPSYDWITQNCVQGAPEKIDGVWTETWVVTDATQEEITQRQNQSMQTNKSEAESLLQQTDWTATVDINNPAYSNPYLGNQDAFLAYRSQVRQIALNPPVTVSEWPTKPEEVWVTV